MAMMEWDQGGGFSYLKISIFYLYLTRQVSKEHILIFNDSLGTVDCLVQGQSDRFVLSCQLGI